MRKLLIALSLLAFGAACKHKTKAPDTMEQPPAAASSKSDMKAASNSNMVKCTKGGEERTLEVVEKDAGCELKLTKQGKTTTPTHSSHGRKKCDDASAKTQKKLAKIGFACQ